MHIDVLGCSGGVGPDLRTTSLLINGHCLMDAGTGVSDLSIRQMAQVTDVYLTHAHLDHVCGLAFMADNLFDEIEHPLRVHATRETLETLRGHLFNWKLWPDFSELPDKENPLITWHEVAPGRAEAVDQLTLTGFRVEHTVPAIGYAVTAPESVFAFTGDTTNSASLWEALNALERLDRLMIEVAFTDEEEELAHISRHMTPRMLGEGLKNLKHRPELLLTHHKPGCEAEIEQQCRSALSGRRYRHLKRGDRITL